MARRSNFLLPAIALWAMLMVVFYHNQVTEDPSLPVDVDPSLLMRAALDSLHPTRQACVALEASRVLETKLTTSPGEPGAPVMHVLQITASLKDAPSGPSVVAWFRRSDMALLRVYGSGCGEHDNMASQCLCPRAASVTSGAPSSSGQLLADSLPPATFESSLSPLPTNDGPKLSEQGNNDETSAVQEHTSFVRDIDGGQWVDAHAGALGETCAATCGSKGLGCDDAITKQHLDLFNNCEAMQYSFACARGCISDAPGPDQPAYFDNTNNHPEAVAHKHRGVCLFNAATDTYPPLCSASYAHTRRLCLCVGTGPHPPARPPMTRPPAPPRPARKPRAKAASVAPPDAQVYIAVHSTVSMLPNVLEIATRFAGPVKAAVLLNEDGSGREAWSSLPPNIEATFLSPQVNGPRYPVNTLRQAALDLVPNGEQDYVLTIDVDFIPSDNLHDDLMYWMPWIAELGNEAVFVLPAFQVVQGIEPPRTLAELDACRDQFHCHFVLELTYPAAHEATDFPQWDTAVEPFEIKWVWTFEPYILAKRSCLPPLPQQFNFYGNDKIAWIYQLAVWGSRFFTLPRVFITHRYHPPNAWVREERDKYKDKVLQDFRTFYTTESKTVLAPQKCMGKAHHDLLA